MTVKKDLIAYRSRWAKVDRFIEKEKRHAAVELRWKQLNSAYTMSKSLGLIRSDNDEMEVIQIWAGLKEKAINPNHKD